MRLFHCTWKAVLGRRLASPICAFHLGISLGSIGRPLSRVGFVFQNHYPRFRGAPFRPFRGPLTPTRSMGAGKRAFLLETGRTRPKFAVFGRGPGRQTPVHRGRVVVTFHDRDRLQVVIAGPYSGHSEAVNTNPNSMVSDALNVQNRRASPIESVRSNPLWME